MKKFINVLLYLMLGLIACTPFIVFNFNYSLEASKLFLGGFMAAVFKWGFVFAFCGMFLRWFYKTRKGIQNTERSYNFFKWRYWIEDNFVPKAFTIIATYIVIFIFLRFSKELLGYETKMFIAFLVGLFLDFLIDKLMSLNPDVAFSKKAKTREDNLIQ